MVHVLIPKNRHKNATKAKMKPGRVGWGGKEATARWANAENIKAHCKARLDLQREKNSLKNGFTWLSISLFSPIFLIITLCPLFSPILADFPTSRSFSPISQIPRTNFPKYPENFPRDPQNFCWGGPIWDCWFSFWFQYFRRRINSLNINLLGMFSAWDPTILGIFFPVFSYYFSYFNYDVVLSNKMSVEWVLFCYLFM